MNVLFVAGFGPIVQDGAASRELYVESLGLGFEDGEDEYRHTDALPGVKHFALWPLSHAADSCFGTDSWPSEVPTPQAWIEFDVEDVETATAELEADGYELLVSAREEPWGQTVTRLIGPDGLLVGITYTPWLRDETE